MSRNQHFTVFSVSEAAKMLKVSRSYINYLIDQGHIDFFLPPGKKRKKITSSALQNFIKDNTFNHSEGLNE